MDKRCMTRTYAAGVTGHDVGSSRSGLGLALGVAGLGALFAICRSGIPAAGAHRPVERT